MVATSFPGNIIASINDDLGRKFLFDMNNVVKE